MTAVLIDNPAGRRTGLTGAAVACSPEVRAWALAKMRADLSRAALKHPARSHAEDARESLSKIAENRRPTNDEVYAITTQAEARILGCPPEGHADALRVLHQLCEQYWGKA